MSQRLQDLIAERQRYEDWIAALAARRDSTPVHVFERVDSDYRERLERVRQELGSRAAELRERMAGSSERLAVLQAEESARLDSKREVELRTAVGEYTAEQWKLLGAEADRELAGIGSQRSALEKELAELTMVLDQSTATRPPAESVPPAHETVQPAVEVAPVQPPASEGSKARPVRQASKTPRTLRMEQPAHAGPRSEQEKTLRCGECGTMNYPTEWYCESCGAELAAL